jgi:hypothetical protein
MKQTRPLYRVGEVVILQPVLPMDEACWGMETTILQRHWATHCDADTGDLLWGWSYKTDVPPPEPTELPPEIDLDGDWVWQWSERDLRKKHQAGMDFNLLMEQMAITP